MKSKDLYNETITSIQSNPTRTGLTVLGIVIGIASVIVMLAIGHGAESSIASSISSLGLNVVTVTGGGGNKTSGVNMGRSNQQTLTMEDVSAIKEKATLAKDVSPEFRSRAQVVASSNNTNTQVIGVESSYASVKSLEMEEGDFLTDEDIRSGTRIAVLGPTTRDDLFGIGESAAGQTVTINKVKFTVVGVYASKGGSGFGSIDDQILIPITTAFRYVSNSQYLSTISVTAGQGEDMQALQSELTTILLDSHGIKDETQANFSIFNQADLASTAQSVTQVFTILLASVASISLLVGGIGIMNMMLTNVRERTREIGLRKAIGARKKDISSQFLVESIIITLIGGSIGVVLGILISLGITSFGILETKVTMFPVLLAFGVSAGIGIVFGYYPAKKASELNPIDALRYE